MAPAAPAAAAGAGKAAAGAGGLAAGAGLAGASAGAMGGLAAAGAAAGATLASSIGSSLISSLAGGGGGTAPTGMMAGMSGGMGMPQIASAATSSMPQPSISASLNQGYNPVQFGGGGNSFKDMMVEIAKASKPNYWPLVAGGAVSGGLGALLQNNQGQINPWDERRFSGVAGDAAVGLVQSLASSTRDRLRALRRQRNAIGR